ncbi:DUF481 domain-containing protein [Algoriphagus litoralis]|uniref:DUF481 domain-containing protein n=1 Tax=Algoriphagus litoralis TaxID=2202829 RepID=UPI000DB9C76C|nr:DUF481 domain-containing protein [Algoriphagus litoralis]
MKRWKKRGKVTLPKASLLLLLFHFFTLSSFAQLNESDTSRFQLRAGFTAVNQKGNVDLFVIRGRLEIVSNSQNAFVFKSQANSLYQEFGGSKADNDLNSRNYLYYRPFRKFYPFSMLYVQTNFRREIDFRWFTGLGYTWQLIQKPRTTLKLSGSMVYETTRFQQNQYSEAKYNGSNTISLPRATLYLTGWHKLLDSKLRLFYSGYWQLGLDITPNNRFQMDLGLDLPIWKGLNASVQYSYSREQVVAISVLQEDRILTFGLSYQLKQ